MHARGLCEMPGKRVLLQPASRSSSCSRRPICPDFNTIATGRGFLRHAEVTLAWEPGIGRVEVIGDADGAFSNPGADLPRRYPATGCSSGDGFVDVGGAVPRRAGHGPSPQISPCS
jgi:hypothetical protein